MNYSTKIKQLQIVASCLRSKYFKFTLCSIIIMLCLYSNAALAYSIVGTTLTATDITDALGATAAEKGTINKLIITATTISGTSYTASDWAQFKTLNTTGGYTSLSEIELSEVTTMPNGVASAYFGGGIMGAAASSWLKRFSAPKVTTIGTAAFYNCAGLEQVSLPALQTIGANAFQNCSKLSSTGLSFPEVTSIGANAFNGCASLKEITALAFPKLTAITSNYIFRACISLQSVNFPNVISSTGTYIFSQCDNLKIMIFPKLVEIVSTGFAGTTGLTEIRADYFPNVTTIGRSAFSSSGSTYGDNNLVSVVFPSVTKLAGQAFGGGTGLLKLTTVTFPALKTLSNDANYPGAFAGCVGITAIDDRNFPLLETLEVNAFNNCTALQSVTLSNVKTIAAGAFNNCNSLRTIALPNVKTIEEETFRDMKNIVTADFSGATSIAREAFYGCTALLNITCPMLETIGDGAFSECPSLSTVNDILLPNLTTIGESAFFNCTGLLTATLSKVTELGASAFSGCTKLETASFATLQNISTYAFSGCTALTQISFPEATNIAPFAFANCLGLRNNIRFPKATAIGESSFGNCQGLTTIETNNFPALRELDGFSDCVYLRTVNMPNIQTIKATAFSGCIALENIHFENVTSIQGDAAWFPAGAFSGCVSLKDLSAENFPVISEIGANAFYGCDMLASVNLSGVVGIGSATFGGCLSLATIEMPALKTIAPQAANNQAAFYNCNSLKDVSLPSLETVNGFVNCANLESAYFENAYNIGANAFATCPKLDSLGFGAALENQIQTTISPVAFGGITTTSIGLAIGTNLLPAPDVTNKTWPTSNTKWKSINVENGVARPELVFETVTNAINFTGNKSITRKITITGQIQGTDYSANSEWSKFKTLNPAYPMLEEIEILTAQDIPNALSTTAVSMFSSTTWLKKFSAPNVKSIGRNAFKECENLEEVYFPAATIIDWNAFDRCSSLSVVSFPALTNLGISAFYSCTNLSSMSFGTNFTEPTNINFAQPFDNVETKNIDLTLSQYVRPYPDFKNNTWNGYEWKSISIGNVPAELAFTSVTDALDYKEYAHAVRKITINGPIQGTDYSENNEWSKLNTLNELYPALSELIILTEQAIPDCDTTVTDGVTAYHSLFYSYDGTDHTYNTWLKSFSAPNAEAIGSYTFYHCEALESISFANAKTAGVMAFASCNALTSIPATAFPRLTTIYNWAFSNCENITEVNFPMAFEIKDNAFVGCFALTKVALPKVTDIGFSAFAECNAIDAIALGIDFMAPTEIRLDAATGLEEIASRTDLTLGYYVVPAPEPLTQNAEDEVLRIWHTYTWQSINLIGKPDYPDLLYTVTLQTFPEDAGATFLANAGGRDLVSIRTVPANDCYHFTGWADSRGVIISEDNPAVLTLERDTNLTAVYLQDNIELKVTAGAGGTVSPEGIVTIPCGSDFVITATADAGYVFSNWTNAVTGQIISGMAIDTLTLEEYKANPAITANFIKEDAPPAEEYTITLLAKPVEGGVVAGAGAYNENATVTVTATANDGYVFGNWTDATGTAVSADSAYSFTLTSDITLTANFRLSAPVITTHPQSQEVAAGSDFTLSVVATGAGLQYQWQKDGADISGAASATYTKTGAIASDGGSYACVVANATGSVTSQSAVITVVQGIEEYVGGFLLSPNPSPDVVHIKLDVLQAGELEISLIDLSGKEVLAVYSSFVEAGAFMRTISLASLPHSAYYLKVIHSGKSKVERIIHN